MSAAEVIALHSICTCGEWAEDIEQHAAHILDALTATGYAVVELPAKAAGCTWPVGEDDDFTVTHVTLQRALDGATEVGAQISWGSLELNLSGADARSLAAALLAAADAAEHPGTPVEASQQETTKS